MFWCVFRIKPFSKIAKNHIEKLKNERNKMIIRNDMNLIFLGSLYKETFEYAHVNLAIEVWGLKIEIWKAILGKND